MSAVIAALIGSALGCDVHQRCVLAAKGQLIAAHPQLNGIAERTAADDLDPDSATHAHLQEPPAKDALAADRKHATATTVTERVESGCVRVHGHTLAIMVFIINRWPDIDQSDAAASVSEWFGALENQPRR